MACRDSGTICSRRIFILSAGISHILSSQSISSHVAKRNSTCRTNVRAVKRTAAHTTKLPGYASRARITARAPSFVVRAAWCFSCAGASAPRKSRQGSLLAFPVATALRKICEQIPKTRFAVSMTPRFSNDVRIPMISMGVISDSERLPKRGIKYSSILRRTSPL